ncbi:MAG: hypothetical protein CMI52_03240 [Parcubacteria group bacterium]|nr:hypothetical protein [Parcubacteria group bacterium]
MSIAFETTHKGSHRAHWDRIIKRGVANEEANQKLRILQMMGISLFDDIFEKAESGTYTLADPSEINVSTVGQIIERTIGKRVDYITLVSIIEASHMPLGQSFPTLLLKRIERKKKGKLLDDPFAREIFRNAYIGIEPPNFGWLYDECMHTLLFTLIYTFYKAASGSIRVKADTQALRECLTSCIPIGQHAKNPTTWFVACG